MTNIFENAYFGKAYKTRDGRKALYIGYDRVIDKHAFIPEDDRITYCFDDGMLFENVKKCVDIVSEWREKIDEEELDKLAKDYISKNSIPYEPLLTIGEQIEAFKVGYRKAKEGGRK